MASCIGFVSGVFAFDDPQPLPVPLTIRRSLPTIWGTVPAFPTDIHLRIVAAKDFRRSKEVKMLTTTQDMSGVGAYTMINSNPCTIVIPDDFKIFVVAQKGDAWFDDTSTGDVIAHEILHCLYGGWHQPWNVIQSKSNLASPKADASLR